jgi:hypothetical protein
MMNSGPLTLQFKQKKNVYGIKYHMKHIHLVKTKLISPPLESFHRDFKAAAYVFNSAPKNYNEVQNN